MTTLPKSNSLVGRVVRRMRFAMIGRRAFVALLVLSGVYAVALLVSRLAGVIPDQFALQALLALPVVAGIMGLILHRRPTAEEAARLIDRQGGTKDLFLTVAMLEGSPGEFKPIVAVQAEERAPRIRPAEVVPLRWERRLGIGVVALLILFAGVQFLPQLDPFGKVEAAQQDAQRQKQLNATQKQTVERVAQIAKEKEEEAQKKDVQKAIDALKATFNQMQPKAKQTNYEKLAVNQKALGEKWRKISADQLKDLMAQQPIAQQFGNNNLELQKKWADDLQKGSTESLQKAIDQVQRDLEELLKTEDPAKQAALKKKLRDQLQQLSEFSRDKVNSKPLEAALKRAAEQLDMACKCKNGMEAGDAIKAAAESMNLTKMELEQIAQSAKELKDLEEALKAIQMAKKLNDLDALDGKQCEGCKSMDEYAKLFAKAMGGNGEGMGEEGRGRGDIAPEDESKKSDFKAEQAKSPITAGKILLSLKTRGMGEKVDAKIDYRNAVQNVKQGLSEAILQEQIPPGYHDGIKSYFDNLQENPDE